MRDIDEWLTALGLAKHASLFAEAEIDFDTLADIEEDDLKELGLPLGPRKKVWGAIKRLGETSNSAASTAPATPLLRHLHQRRHPTPNAAT